MINNDLSSEYFNLTRGVRQGGPLSLYLFLIAVETLAIAIRENEEIKGIVIDKQETKFLQYADDITAVLSDTESAPGFSRRVLPSKFHGVCRFNSFLTFISCAALSMSFVVLSLLPRGAFHGVFTLGYVSLDILESAVVAGFVVRILLFHNVC